MSGINTGRVLLGGLVAGLVINVSESVLNMGVLAKEMAAVMTRFNLPVVGMTQVGVFMAFGFLLGIVMVWLYAAIRPRFGPGPKTACIAGAAVWFLGYLYTSVGMVNLGFYPMQTMAISLGWGFVEVLVAINAGAYLYKE